MLVSRWTAAAKIPVGAGRSSARASSAKPGPGPSPSREFCPKKQQQQDVPRPYTPPPSSSPPTHDTRPLHSLMLRTSIRSVRGLSNRPVAAAHGRQWQAAAAVARPAGLAARVSLNVAAFRLGTRLTTALLTPRDTLQMTRRRSPSRQPPKRIPPPRPSPLHPQASPMSPTRPLPPRMCP